MARPRAGSTTTEPRAPGTTPTEGRFFQYIFRLPESNRKRGRKPRTTSTRKQPRKISTGKPPRKETPEPRRQQPRPEPTPAEVEASKEKRRQYERRRSQTPERKENSRRYAREHQMKVKETRTCRNCPNPAIPGETRCPTCAAQHRIGHRRAKERASQQRRQASGQASMF